MSTGLLIFIVLAAPVCLLAGVGAGAVLTWRVLRGMSPVPSIFQKKSRVEQAEKKQAEDRRKPPRVAA